MYQVASSKAEEFIHDGEIVETLAYARENRANRPLIEAILQKAAEGKGVTHREAAVLLECELEDLNQRMFTLAKQIKEKIYGNRIVMFAPLYLSNYCINGCVYCPYHQKNKTIPRRKLTQDEIRREVIALQDMGHKRLALEAGEDPRNNPIEYILESIKTIYSVHHKNGAIRRVNVNIAATTVENYRKLKEAGIGTYILFQETYHKENYLNLHPTGPNCAMQASAPTFSARKPTTKPLTKHSTPPARRATTPITPKRWTARWKAASTTWVSAYCSV